MRPVSLFTHLFALCTAGFTAASCRPPLEAMQPRNTGKISKVCGSHLVPEAVSRASRQLERDVVEPSNSSQKTEPLIIPTYLHVIESKSKRGFVQEKWLHDQMTVLNETFLPHNIQFILKNITWTVNDFWAEDAFNARKEKGLALRQGGYDELNIFFETGLLAGDKSTGVCAFPVQDPLNEGEEGTPYAIIDGCHVNPGTLPGGPGQAWQPLDNKGKLATHEVGHWFGLLHTFSGTSCTGDGDYIDDTPQQRDPTNGGCPVGKDSCPDLPGLDPIHNYMDYADQDCQYEFTQDQEERMHSSFNNLRKGRSFNIHALSHNKTRHQD